MTIDNLEAELRKTPEPVAPPTEVLPMIEAVQSALTIYRYIRTNPDAEWSHLFFAQYAVESSILKLHEAGFRATAQLFFVAYKSANANLSIQ